MATCPSSSCKPDERGKSGNGFSGFRKKIFAAAWERSTGLLHRLRRLAMNCALCQANSGENVAFFVAIAKACRNNLWAIAIPITLGGLPAARSR